MAIDFRIRIDGPVLRSTASGRDGSLEEVRAYGTAVIEAAAANGCSRALCDERALTYAIDALDTFDHATYVAERAPRVARIAIVCAPVFAAEGEFFATVAGNRGVNVRLFHDLEAADAWVTAGLATEATEPAAAAAAAAGAAAAAVDEPLED